MICALLLAVLVSPSLSDQFCPGFNEATWFSANCRNCYKGWSNNASLTTQNWCYNTITYELQSHVTLNDPTAIREDGHVGAVLSQTVNNTFKNCGEEFDKVHYCHSWCTDKQVETMLINASMRYWPDQDRSVWELGEANMKSIGKADWPLLLFVMDTQYATVNFQYYNDTNFCALDVLSYTGSSPDLPYGWPYRHFWITGKVPSS